MVKESPTVATRQVTAPRTPPRCAVCQPRETIHVPTIRHGFPALFRKATSDRTHRQKTQIVQSGLNLRDLLP